jgi:hypothetical protein
MQPPKIKVILVDMNGLIVIVIGMNNVPGSRCALALVQSKYLQK